MVPLSGDVDQNQPGVLAAGSDRGQGQLAVTGTAGQLAAVRWLCGGISAAALYGRLPAAAPELTGPEGEPRGQIALALVAMPSASRSPSWL